MNSQFRAVTHDILRLRLKSIYKSLDTQLVLKYFHPEARTSPVKLRLRTLEVTPIELRPFERFAPKPPPTASHIRCEVQTAHTCKTGNTLLLESCESFTQLCVEANASQWNCRQSQTLCTGFVRLWRHWLEAQLATAASYKCEEDAKILWADPYENLGLCCSAERIPVGPALDDTYISYSLKVNCTSALPVHAVLLATVRYFNHSLSTQM